MIIESAYKCTLIIYFISVLVIFFFIIKEYIVPVCAVDWLFCCHDSYREVD